MILEPWSMHKFSVRTSFLCREWLKRDYEVFQDWEACLNLSVGLGMTEGKLGTAHLGWMLKPIEIKLGIEQLRYPCRYSSAYEGGRNWLGWFWLVYEPTEMSHLYSTHTVICESFSWASSYIIIYHHSYTINISSDITLRSHDLYPDGTSLHFATYGAKCPIAGDVAKWVIQVLGKKCPADRPRGQVVLVWCPSWYDSSTHLWIDTTYNIYIYIKYILCHKPK